MSRSASTTTTSELLRPIVPPSLPRKAFFSERDLASKMGKSTQAFRVSMLTCLVIGHRPGNTRLQPWGGKGGVRADTGTCRCLSLGCRCGGSRALHLPAAPRRAGRSWSRDCACTDHVADHALITWLIMH